MNLANVLDIEQLAEKTPGISARQWKYWLQLDLDNFRSRCVIKISRRVFLVYDEVENWVAEHRCSGSEPLEDVETAETA